LNFSVSSLFKKTSLLFLSFALTTTTAVFPAEMGVFSISAKVFSGHISPGLTSII
jgi:hypothetical protein